MHHGLTEMPNQDFNASAVILRLKLLDLKQTDPSVYDQQVVSTIGGNLVTAITRRLERRGLLPVRDKLLKEKVEALTLQNPSHTKLPWIERVADLSQTLKAKGLF